MTHKERLRKNGVEPKRGKHVGDGAKMVKFGFGRYGKMIGNEN